MFYASILLMLQAALLVQSMPNLLPKVAVRTLENGCKCSFTVGILTEPKRTETDVSVTAAGTCEVKTDCEDNAKCINHAKQNVIMENTKFTLEFDGNGPKAVTSCQVFPKQIKSVSGDELWKIKQKINWKKFVINFTTDLLQTIIETYFKTGRNN
eukprot:TRINITY_DN14937_c0_g1_i2.p1 TRINITY_DN14937_c0_g1~~TRINITY_DN14937_c0_g1_i2.p1  ORF type:complete len:155 (-),score=20.78 TRINITY_DN14937_c0_g1_i2:15-479(-)